jgi:deoxycytidylate deaminase
MDYDKIPYKNFYRAMEQLKDQSKCLDKQVVCIITDVHFYTLSYGVNQVLGCDKQCDNKENRLCIVQHAEINAINNCNDTLLKRRAVYAFVNLFPCASCQKALEATGIEKIISFSPKHKLQVFENIEIVNINNLL